MNEIHLILFFANHVLYHILLNDIEHVLSPKFDNLLKVNGHTMISLGVEEVFEKLKPEYNLKEYLDEC